jgi:hypothetical protein
VDERVDAGLDTGLERVEITTRTCHRCVVAVEDREDTAFSEDPRRLGESELGVGDVAERRVEDDDVEGSVLERELPRVAPDEGEVRKVARKVSATLDEDRRRVDADDLSDTGPSRQRARDAPEPQPSSATWARDGKSMASLARSSRMSTSPSTTLGSASAMLA